MSSSRLFPIWGAWRAPGTALITALGAGEDREGRSSQEAQLKGREDVQQEVMSALSRHPCHLHRKGVRVPKSRAARRPSLSLPRGEAGREEG